MDTPTNDLFERGFHGSASTSVLHAQHVYGVVRSPDGTLHYASLRLDGHSLGCSCGWARRCARGAVARDSAEGALLDHLAAAARHER